MTESPLLFKVKFKGNFTEFSAVFLDLKVGDKFLDFEVLQKFDNDVADGKVFVKFGFANTEYDVLFQCNDKRGVILIGNAQNHLVNIFVGVLHSLQRLVDTGKIYSNSHKPDNRFNNDYLLIFARVNSNVGSTD